LNTYLYIAPSTGSDNENIYIKNLCPRDFQLKGVGFFVPKYLDYDIK